ncbi:MAG TPA: DUF2813 domain-containing protein [Thioploca sp.]|nr:DUF2813 domain-containing protein [Thioploca sp.]
MIIKSIYIDNFKILNNFRLDFEPVTVLIGDNSVGKSTILQALELLSYTQGKKYGTLLIFLDEKNHQLDFSELLELRQYLNNI